jgi:hypothetical protein
MRPRGTLLSMYLRCCSDKVIDRVVCVSDGVTQFTEISYPASSFARLLVSQICAAFEVL